ncbi:MAG: YciI family protein [Luteolibacter sp.]
MIIPTHSTGHLILFRGTDWCNELSMDEIQNVMSRWNDWVEGLKKDGRLIAASPLENEGRVITGKNANVADGPFAESKEAVGGYFYVNVESIDEAVEIARQCPGLPHGIIVEVRPVAPSCPIERMNLEAAAAAQA